MQKELMVQRLHRDLQRLDDGGGLAVRTTSPTAPALKSATGAAHVPIGQMHGGAQGAHPPPLVALVLPLLCCKRSSFSSNHATLSMAYFFSHSSIFSLSAVSSVVGCSTFTVFSGFSGGCLHLLHASCRQAKLWLPHRRQSQSPVRCSNTATLRAALLGGPARHAMGQQRRST